MTTRIIQGDCIESSQLKEKTMNERHAPRSITVNLPIIIAIAIACASACGCAMLSPGGEVEKSHAQFFKIGWTDAEFNAESRGAQENGFTMMEGEIVMKLNEDGVLVPDVELSKITAYLYSNPSSKENTIAGKNYADAGVQMATVVSGVVEGVIRAVKGDPAPRPVEPEPDP